MRTLWTIALLAAIGIASTGLRPAGGVQVGDQVPEIALPNPDGDTLRLSELRGQMVVVHFWASWCRACRLHNQRYKKLYARYADSSFISGDGMGIFSISLDDDKTKWASAITNDKLNWSHHVSDLQKWDSPLVEQFGIRDIPFNLIVDRDGKIIGKNIHQNELNTFIKGQLSP